MLASDSERSAVKPQARRLAKIQMLSVVNYSCIWIFQPDTEIERLVRSAVWRMYS